MSNPQSPADFELDPRLAADTVAVGRFPLCHVLLSRDGRYPWLLLVPARAGLRELHELTPPERSAFMDESCALAAVLARLFQPDKLNVAALGNVVPQLHVHHVARFTSDAAWPGPIWGQHPPLPYTADGLAERLRALREALSEVPGFVAARG